MRSESTRALGQPSETKPIFGAVMRDMPAWIDPDFFVEVPLERTYQAAWDVCPPDFRYLIEHGKLPDE